ncbi:hypothetical protein [Candidatus Electrothrix sp.]|uniref:hypothetical protein n=1 Tax=Candidatus Electrothrix sp. TaxID=2170559 RepID=UPI00405763C4
MNARIQGGRRWRVAGHAGSQERKGYTESGGRPWSGRISLWRLLAAGSGTGSHCGRGERTHAVMGMAVLMNYPAAEQRGSQIILTITTTWN